MRFFTILVLLMVSSLVAAADEYSVYRCDFDDERRKNAKLFMKKYYDTQSKMYLGKIDIREDWENKESTSTKIYQIPLQDNESYLQIWYAPSVRVHAQFYYNSRNLRFRATYSKNSEHFELLCTDLSD